MERWAKVRSETKGIPQKRRFQRVRRLFFRGM